MSILPIPIYEPEDMSWMDAHDTLLAACEILKQSDKNYNGKIYVDYDKALDQHIIILDNFTYFSNLANKMNLVSLMRFFHETISYIIEYKYTYFIDKNQIVYYSFKNDKYVYEIKRK